MPHVVLAGWRPLEEVAPVFEPSVDRWGRAVLKTAGWWLRHDGQALLVEGVVVELSRPLHPVAMVSQHHGDTAVRLWPTAPVERTMAVQYWLATLASKLRAKGLGAVVRTNLPGELLEGLGLT